MLPIIAENEFLFSSVLILLLFVLIVFSSIRKNSSPLFLVSKFISILSFILFILYSSDSSFSLGTFSEIFSKGCESKYGGNLMIFS